VGNSESTCSVYFKILATATSSYTCRLLFKTFSPTSKNVLYPVQKRKREREVGEIKRRGRERHIALWLVARHACTDPFTYWSLIIIIIKQARKQAD
jgi:hypothetical protein